MTLKPWAAAIATLLNVGFSPAGFASICGSYVPPGSNEKADAQGPSSVPASPYPGDMQADARKIFEELLSLSRLTAVTLAFRDGDCFASGDSSAPGRGKIVLCSNLPRLVNTKGQLAFIMGHELGHIKFGHVQTLEREGDALYERWRSSLKDGLTPTQKVRDLERNFCPEYTALHRRLETEADDFSANLAVQAGFKAWDVAAVAWRFHDLELQNPQWPNDPNHPRPRMRAERLEGIAEDIANQLGQPH